MSSTEVIDYFREFSVCAGFKCVIITKESNKTTRERRTIGDKVHTKNTFPLSIKNGAEYDDWPNFWMDSKTRERLIHFNETKVTNPGPTDIAQFRDRSVALTLHVDRNTQIK